MVSWDMLLDVGHVFLVVIQLQIFDYLIFMSNIDPYKNVYPSIPLFQFGFLDHMNSMQVFFLLCNHLSVVLNKACKMAV